MTPIFAALTVLLAAAPPPPPPPPAPAPAPAPGKPSADPAVALATGEVDAMMAGYKGKPLAGLVQRLGPIDSSRPANDGQVVFWRNRISGPTKCGLNPATGAFGCTPAWSKECRLAVAANTPGNVVAWKLSGDVEACTPYLNTPPPSAPPPAK